MKSKLIAFVVSVVMIASLPSLSGVRCEAPSMAEILPQDSLGYAELPNMEVFYYLIGELGEAAIESLEQEPTVPEDIKVKATAILEAFEEIKPLLPKSASLGVVSIDPQSGQPSLLIMSELSEAIGPLASAAGKLLAAVPNVKTKKTEYGTEVIIPHGPPPIGYAVVNNVLYLATGEGFLDRVLSRQSSESLATTAHFKQVNLVTGESAIVSAYLNVDAIREKLLPLAPPQAKQFVELLGLKDVHAAAISLAADEEQVGFNLALQYTEDAPGIASLLSVPNTEPKGIAYVPDDFSYVTRFSLGAPDAFMEKVRALLERAGLGPKIDQAFAQVKENAGIDVNKVLASLGGEITIGVKVPQTLEIPNVVACVEVRDPEYLGETLKNLLTGLGITSSEIEMDGKKVMMIVSPGVPVSPAIAMDGDVAVIGISKAVLQKALAAKANGQNIASKPSFKAAMEGLPADKNIALEYIEMDDLGRLAVGGLSIAAGMAPAEVKPLIARGMPYLSKALQDLEAGAEVVYRTPNGLAVQSRWGTRSLMQILKNGAAFGAKAAVMFAHHGRREDAPPEMETTAERAAPTE